jgi:hypothetical protein
MGTSTVLVQRLCWYVALICLLYVQAVICSPYDLDYLLAGTGNNPLTLDKFSSYKFKCSGDLETP